VELNALREHLLAEVRGQGGATDPLVADSLRVVPRHIFLPDLPPDRAYRDEPIVTKRDSSGEPTSSSSQPTIMAIMLDQLRVARGHRVLEIGAGTGFNAALLHQIVGPKGRVTSIDLDEDVVEIARENLDACGCKVTVLHGDGALGHPAGAPYDRIIATVGVSDLAPAWLEQLAPDGRIVVPLDLRGVQRSIAFERDGNHWTSSSAMPCGFMRMRGSLTGPEQTYVLDKESALTLSVPEARDLDTDAVREVLTEPPTELATGVSPTMAELFDGLCLWLAIREPRWFTMSERATATAPVLGSAPLSAPDTVVTAGLLDEVGLALLTTRDEELVVASRGSEDIAADLVKQVRAWDSAGRPGTPGLRIDAYPDGSGTGEFVGDFVIDKGYCRFVLSWP
jgi:protein-L-isoaspartate(D-aspartate) O-methyltransferase